MSTIWEEDKYVPSKHYPYRKGRPNSINKEESQ